MKYNSPKEYADLVKSDLHEFAAEPDDLDIRLAALNKHYQDQLEAVKNMTVGNNKYTETNTMYIRVVELLVDDFYKTLPIEIKENFEKLFHFTTIDNRYTNASIRRSPNKNFFGVFINSSLITLLHRYGKLEFATINPQDVVFCSRYPDRKVTHSEIIEMFAEMHLYFTTMKMAHGPYILLAGPSQSAHMLRLNIQEKLIMYHEIGHFLNGDLFDDVGHKKLFDFAENNIYYQREYLADLVGFGLYIRELKHNGNISTIQRHFALYAIISMYIVLHGLQGIESDRYPHPLNRMCLVIDYYYGTPILDIVDNALKENKIENLSINSLPEIVSNEDEMLSYINNRLSEAFNEAAKEVL